MLRSWHTVVLALALLPLGGCGYVAAVLPLLLGGGGGGGGGATNSPPSLSVQAIDRQDGSVSLPVVVRDADDATVEVGLFVSADSGASYVEATLATGQPLVVPASPTGTSASLVWDSIADIGDPASPNVFLKFFVADEVDSETLVVGPVLVGNDVPTVAFDGTTPSNVRGLVEIGYLSADSTSDPVSVALSVSIDGGAFFAASVSVGETSNLSTSPAGDFHTLAWDSLADVGQKVQGGVLLRLEARDTETGPSATLGPLFVVNDDRPVAFLTSPNGGDVVADDVGLTYLLIDANGDDLTVALEYSVGDAGWVPLEAVPGLGEGTTNLASSLDGLAHAFFWDSQAAGQLTAIDTESLRLRVRPFDATGEGIGFTTGVYLLLDNNEEPIVGTNFNTGPVRVGQVPIGADLGDVEGDTLDVELSFSVAGGAFVRSFSVTGASGIAPDGLGDYSAGLLWDSAADSVGFSQPVQVNLLLASFDRSTAHTLAGTLRDLLQRGGSTLTGNFTVDNTEPPRITLGTPTVMGPGPLSEIIEVPYAVVDREANPATLIVEFFDPSQVAFRAATIAEDLSHVATSADSSVSGTFHWDTLADFGPSLVDPATLRVSVRDSKIGDTAVITPAIDNNEPPTVSIVPPSGALSGSIVIQVRVFDSNSDPVDVSVRFLDPSTNMPRMLTLTGDTTAIASSPGGTLHSYTWNTAQDLGLEDFHQVTVLFTPSDSETGPTEQVAFDIGNASLVSRAVLSADIARIFAGPVTIPYRLFDGDSDPQSVRVTWRQGSQGSFALSTRVTGAGNDTTGLASSPGGSPSVGSYTFVWDATFDLGGLATDSLQVRVEPRDNDSVGTADLSNVFAHGNDAPVISLSGLGDTVFSGIQVLRVSVLDSTRDPSTVGFFYAVGGGPLQPATVPVGAPSSAVTPPNTFDIGWNTIADLGTVDRSAGAVLFIATVADQALAGTPDTLSGFSVDNDDLPVIFVAAPAAGQVVSDTVFVDILLIDPQSDTLDLTAEFSASPWQDMTLDLLRQPIVDLPSSPQGRFVRLYWLSSDDLPEGFASGDADSVRIRFSGNDGLNQGPLFEGQVFAINNNDGPSIAPNALSGTHSGMILLQGTVSDPEGDTIDVEVRYSKGGGPFNPAPFVSGTTGLVPPGPGNLPYALQWDTQAALVGILGPEQVNLSFAAFDRSNGQLSGALRSSLQEGNTLFSGNFFVDNSTKPVVTIESLYVAGGGALRDDVTVAIRIHDLEANPASLTFEFRNPLTASFKQALATVLTGDPLHMETADTGFVHLVVWHTREDLGHAFLASQDMRMRARDSKIGDFVTTTVAIDNNEPPVAIPSIVGSVEIEGNASFRVLILDSNSDAADLEWRLVHPGPGPLTGQLVVPSFAAGSADTASLATAPFGIAYVYNWASVADLGLRDIDDVSLVFTARDTDPGASTTLTVQLRNFRLSPVALIIDEVLRSPSTPVYIPYQLLDGNSSVQSIRPEWRVGNGGWNLASSAPVVLGPGPGQSDGTTNLAASASGVDHVFAWDAANDVPFNPLMNGVNNVQIKITPIDIDTTPDGGTPDSTNVFDYGQDAPTVTLSSPDTVFTGIQAIDFDLQDANLDASGVFFQYRFTSAGGWLPATITIGPDSSIVLSTPTLSNVGWNTVADLGAQNYGEGQVELRCIPFDRVLGTTYGEPDTLRGFSVNNNDSPVMFVAVPTDNQIVRGAFGLETIALDAQSDTISVLIQFQRGGTSGIWTGASITSDTSDLPTTALGVAYTFEWLSADPGDIPAAPGMGDEDSVRVRMQPDDGKNPAGFFESEWFRADDNEEPVASVVEIFVPVDEEGRDLPQSDTVAIRFLLSDPEGETDIFLVAEFSTDQGQTFTPMTIDGSTPTTGITATPTPATKTLIWNSEAAGNLPDSIKASVIVRITPFDHDDPDLGQGEAAQSAAFAVNNTGRPGFSFSNVFSASGFSALPVPPDTLYGVLLVVYDPLDAEGNPATVELRMMAVGGASFVPVVEGNGGQGPGPHPVPSQRTFFVDSERTLVNPLTAREVVLIGRARGLGTLAEAPPGDWDTIRFFLDDTPVAVSMQTPVQLTPGLVSIEYTLLDVGADSADVAVQYSLNGVTFFGCTAANQLGNEGTQNLGTSSSGRLHRFTWNSYSNVGNNLLQVVNLRVVPTERNTGRPGIPDSQASILQDLSLMQIIAGKGIGDNGLATSNGSTSVTYGAIVDFIESQIVVASVTFPKQRAQPATRTVGNNTDLVFIPDVGNSRVRAVNVGTQAVVYARVAIDPMEIETIAGNGNIGFHGDGGPATAAELAAPAAVLIDRNGDLVIADSRNHRIRRVHRLTGVITTIAGSAQSGNLDGPALSARLNFPVGLSEDPMTGNLFWADYDNSTVRMLDMASGQVSTVVGTGASAPLDPTPSHRLEYRLNDVSAVHFTRSVGTAQLLLIAEGLNDRIVATNLGGIEPTIFSGVTVRTDSVVVIAGNGAGAGLPYFNPAVVVLGDGGSFDPSTEIGRPMGMDCDASRFYYTALGTAGGQAYGIPWGSGTVTSLYSSLQSGWILGISEGQGGPGEVFVPFALGTEQVKRVSKSGGAPTTLAGSVVAVNTSGVATLATEAGLDAIGFGNVGLKYGVSSDSAGNVYICERAAGRSYIRRIERLSGLIGFVLGTGLVDIETLLPGVPIDRTTAHSSRQINDIDFLLSDTLAFFTTDCGLYAMNLGLTSRPVLGTNLDPGELVRLLGRAGTLVGIDDMAANDPTMIDQDSLDILSSVAISQDGRYVAIGQAHNSVDRKRRVMILNLDPAPITLANGTLAIPAASFRVIPKPAGGFGYGPIGMDLDDGGNPFFGDFSVWVYNANDTSLSIFTLMVAPGAIARIDPVGAGNSVTDLHVDGRGVLFLARGDPRVDAFHTGMSGAAAIPVGTTVLLPGQVERVAGKAVFGAFTSGSFGPDFFAPWNTTLTAVVGLTVDTDTNVIFIERQAPVVRLFSGR